MHAHCWIFEIFIHKVIGQSLLRWIRLYGGLLMQKGMQSISCLRILPITHAHYYIFWILIGFCNCSFITYYHRYKLLILFIWVLNRSTYALKDMVLFIKRLIAINFHELLLFKIYEKMSIFDSFTWVICMINSVLIRINFFDHRQFKLIVVKRNNLHYKDK